MFDHEYDILYALVKDKEISSGVTFEDVLMSYAESKEHFKNAIDKELLLTIYVPELTNWDANKWNTAEEVPIVAVCDEYKKKKTTKVLAFDKMETPSYWDYNIMRESLSIMRKIVFEVQVRMEKICIFFPRQKAIWNFLLRLLKMIMKK